MNTEPKPEAPDDLFAWLKKLEQANTSFADKMRKTSDDFSKRMEALGEMPTLSSFPTFRGYAQLGKIVRSLKSRPDDLELIAGLIDALDSPNADAVRTALRSIKTA
jgi:hypothetical protein